VGRDHAGSGRGGEGSLTYPPHIYTIVTLATYIYEIPTLRAPLESSLSLQGGARTPLAGQSGTILPPSPKTTLPVDNRNAFLYASAYER